MPVLSASACAEKIFAMSEVIELENDASPIAGIIQNHTWVRVDSTKAVQDKLLVKGDSVTDVCYLSADNSQMIGTYRHTMPISQVIETVGVTEEDVQDVSLRVLSSSVTPKTDGNGENRLLEITLQIGVSARCFGQASPDWIYDAYSTAAELKPKYNESEMLTDYVRWQDNVRIREQISLAGTDIQSLRLVCTDDVQVICTVKDGAAAAYCTTTLGILGINSDGASVWTEKQVEFTCRRTLDDPSADVICTPIVCITRCDASLGADGTLDLQAEGCIDGMLYTLESVHMLTSASTEPFSSDRDPAALTIYFADVGESVWDIARRYRTTADAVCAENGLTDDTVAEKQMLVIPLV